MAKLQLINHKDIHSDSDHVLLSSSTLSTKAIMNNKLDNLSSSMNLKSSSWIDKYQPQDLSELPVFHTKVIIY